MQIAVTGMLTLICIPKFYAVVSKKKDDAMNHDNVTITGRAVGPTTTGVTDVFDPNRLLRDISTQTEPYVITVSN